MGCPGCCRGNDYRPGFCSFLPCLIPVIGLIVACTVGIPILVLANGQEPMIIAGAIIIGVGGLTVLIAGIVAIVVCTRSRMKQQSYNTKEGNESPVQSIYDY